MTPAPDPAHPKQPAGLARRLGVAGLDTALLRQALTHPSRDGEPHFERLEFLGDAVLKLVVSQWLHDRQEGLNEGAMTQVRARVVSDVALARAAEAMGLPEYVRVGAPALMVGTARLNILAASFEAILAVVYMASGQAGADGFLRRWLQPEYEASLAIGGRDNPKVDLQERVAARWKSTPTYETVGAVGPVHDCTFEVVVHVEGRAWGRGEAKSKKDAEKLAAQEALRRLAEEGMWAAP